jgi:23S rRNA pseudouridine2604 synthase
MAGNTVRINKYFTEQGHCSRRVADKLIEEGRVTINGRVAVLGDQIQGEDVIAVDGRAVAQVRRPVYLAYHKPVGVTSTTELHVKDNIIEAVGYSDRIFPIGRLDKDSSGLILLTNDGDIVNPILRTEFGHEREYVVTLERPYDEEFLRRLEQGVMVLGNKTKPCRTVAVDRLSFRIILTEGRNRQIRRMCSGLGHRVTALVRVRIMEISLGALAEGQWRLLSDAEQRHLLSAVGRAQTQAVS